MPRILVIKLGAFGDVVLAFGPFAAIRAHHEAAEITLLTTAPYAEFARATPWFDCVIVDTRPRVWDLPRLVRLRAMLRGFDRVYDLQTSDRSGWYFQLAGRPDWSGIAHGCSLPHANPRRDAMHTIERQREQLEMAGIRRFPQPALTFLKTPSLLGRGLGEGPTDPERQHPYAPPAFREQSAILIPGAAPHRPAKKWPADHFATLSATLTTNGLTPIIVGTAADTPSATIIRQTCPSAVDLTGRTTLLQLAQTIATARLAIGNDTGPTHLAAALGIPTLALFSADSDPALTRPRGDVTILTEPNLTDLTVARVAAALPPVHLTPSLNTKA